MTQLTYADRVQEYATNPGATTFLLAGASAVNLRTFANGGLEGETTAYSAVHRTSGQWEVGIGVYAAGYLTRVTILSNSSGTLLPITFSSGTVDVANDIPASEIVTFDSAGGFAVPGILTVTGAATFGSTGTFTGAVTAPSFVGALVGNASTATYATSAGASSTATLAAAATILATGRTIAMTGDLTWTSASFNGSGNVTGAGTLATVNSDTGASGGSTAIPVITVNGKGLVTAVSTAAVIAPAGTLTGTTLAANVVTSSLTSTGTLTVLTVSGVVTFTSAAANVLIVNGATTGATYAKFQNTSGQVIYGSDGSVPVISGGGTYEGFIGTNVAKNFNLLYNGNVRASITTGGMTVTGTFAVSGAADVSGVLRALSGAATAPSSGKGMEMYYDSSADRAFITCYDRGTPGFKPFTLESSATRILSLAGSGSRPVMAAADGTLSA